MVGSGRVWDREEPRKNLEGFRSRDGKCQMKGGGGGKNLEKKTPKKLRLGHNEVGVFVSVTS